MAQPLIDLVEQFCTFQRKQRGKTEGGVRTYGWNLGQYLAFVGSRRGRPACVGEFEPTTIQAWMDRMAAADLAIGTMRVRQSTVSSLCPFLVKRGHLDSNPVARLDRPPHRREAPRQVPGSAIMDALVRAAQQRQRPRDLAIFLALRYSGMRRESVATLRVRNLDRHWGLRNVPVKGGKTRDIPQPAAVMEYLDRYVTHDLPHEVNPMKPDTPLFWSTFGQRRQGTVRRPTTGKNIWRICKTYGRQIGYPMLKPHDLRHGVAMEIYEQHRDLEQVRGLLGHTRIETTQVYAQIRPAALKRALEFYEAKAIGVLTASAATS